MNPPHYDNVEQIKEVIRKDLQEFGTILDIKPYKKKENQPGSLFVYFENEMSAQRLLEYSSVV